MMNPIPAPYRWLAWLVLIISALVGAAALGWWLGQPKPVQETAAPAQRQVDGSMVLERRPDPDAKPKQQIPPKAKLERVAQVTVQPSAAPAGEPCPSISVDMSLVREEDGGRRLLASSPDGTIIGGVDVPVESAALPVEPLRWAAGLSWSHAQQTGGLWVERDVPLFSQVVRIGAEVNQDRIDQEATGIDARLRIGFAF
jgi:hypothetical protein